MVIPPRRKIGRRHRVTLWPMRDHRADNPRWMPLRIRIRPGFAPTDSVTCTIMRRRRSNAPRRPPTSGAGSVSYTHLRAHETVLDLVCRLLLEKKKKKNKH